MFANLDNTLSALQTGSNPPPKLPAGTVFELHPLQLTGWIEAVWEAWRVFHSNINNNNRFNPSTATAPFVGLSHVDDQECYGIGNGPILTNGPSSTNTSYSNFPVYPCDLIDRALRAIDPDFRISNGVTIENRVREAAKDTLEELFHIKSYSGGGSGTPTGSTQRLVRPWLHLIYAYLIENTRIVDICERVLRKALHDETFGVLSDASHRWLRTTEDLFFRDGPSSLVQSVTSWLRTDLRSSRANAYYRMFGMETNHGAADGKPYPFNRPETANTDFVRTLVEWLRELWRGYQNATNFSGPTATDPGAIDELTNRLKTMLNARRQSSPGHSNLSREELVFVSMMSWFDLTVSFDSPIVVDLKANGTTPEERTTRLGKRVDLPASTHSRSFFVLAQNLPLLLVLVEEGQFDSQADQLLLYRDEGTIRTAVLNVITHWSMATGQNLKAVPTTR